MSKTQEFMKEHLDPNLANTSNILSVTAAYQKISGESDAELLMLALTWMIQMNMGPGWVEMLRQCQKQQADSNAAFEADKEERRKAAVAALGPAYGMGKEARMKQLLDNYTKKCAEASHKSLDNMLKFQGSPAGNPDMLRIAQAELAKRKQTDIV